METIEIEATVGKDTTRENKAKKEEDFIVTNPMKIKKMKRRNELEADLQADILVIKRNYLRPGIPGN